MHVQQVIWKQRGVAELQPRDLPPPSDDQVIVRTRVTLISPGTERAFFLGAPGAVFPFPGPAVGYCNVGEIVELGAQVSGLQIGQRVPCPGGHATHCAVSAGACLAVPEGVAEEAAVFCSLIAIALQGVRKARIELGEAVCVIGAGLIGLLAMQLAKLQGGLPVTVIDQDDARAAFARQLGADATESNFEPAVVIEATGVPPAVNRALQIAGRFARVILLGSTRGDVNDINVYRDVHYKGLTIIGAHNSTRPKTDSAPGWWTLADDTRTALRLLAAQRLVTAPLITHRFPFTDAPQAYDLLARGDLRAHGMILQWA